MDIGNKLKQLRILKGLTQEELADRAELSKGYISQLERDLTSPSIATLMDILQCLGTSIGEFFNEEPEEQVVFGKSDYFEKVDAESGCSVTWIIPNAQKNRMEPILLTLEPGGSTCPDTPHEGGRVWIHFIGLRLHPSGRQGPQGEERRVLLLHLRQAALSDLESRGNPHLGQRPAQFLIFLPEDNSMKQPLIDLVGISKSFGGELVLDDLNLSVKENSFVTLLGPSGCGKTTTLRIIGGFTSPDSGKVIFGGEDITKLPPNRRQLNTVFQKYALFTHMSIAENIAFGLKIKGKSKDYINDKIKYALKLVNLAGYENRSVDSLSGGQQQRIAIARAIVNEPRVLLLDEPLGALDLKLRQDMQYELIRLKNELGITFIYVTHDQEEALTMSDTIVVMNQGYIQQMGTPEQIYNEPENAFVADFIGESNIVDGLMLRDELVEISGAKFACVDKGFGVNKPVDVVIRPEDIDLVEPEAGTLKGVVTHLIFKGVHYEMEVTTPDGYEWLVHSTDMFPVGKEVGIRVDPFDIQIMNKPASEDEEAVGINE